MVRDARDLLDHIPMSGEALHAVITGRYDLMHLIVGLIDIFGVAESVRIATLCYNARNFHEIVRLLDDGKVRFLSLLCSSFFRDHNKELWEETQEAFAERGQRAAASRSHCKVVTLHMGGVKLSVEGSANLRSNGNWEQVAIIRHDELHDWHAAWIDAAIIRYEGSDDGEKAAH